MTKLMTVSDAVEMERRYGVAYFVSADQKTCLPATHVGAGRVAMIQLRQLWYPTVCWTISDANGKTLLRGEEVAHHGNVGVIAAYKRAVRSIRGSGCGIRVRPGNRGVDAHESKRMCAYLGCYCKTDEGQRALRQGY